MTPSRNVDPKIAERLDRLAADGSLPVSWDEVRASVEQVLATGERTIGLKDLQLFAEVKAIARYIVEIKHEIAALQPGHISEDHIRAAADELDAVVVATETATNAIMSAAEAIEAVAKAPGSAQSQVLSQATTRIYEACTFQDITGQRIAKAVGALKVIEEKIDLLLETFGDETGQPGAGSAPASEPSGGGGVVLAGPRPAADANDQDDIDALLAGLE